MTLPGANLASNELLLKLCKAYFALRQLTDQAGVSLLIGLEEKTEKNVITKEEALLKLEAGEEIGSYGQFDIFTREESMAAWQGWEAGSQVEHYPPLARLLAVR